MQALAEEWKKRDRERESLVQKKVVTCLKLKEGRKTVNDSVTYVVWKLYFEFGEERGNCSFIMF